MTLPHVAVGDVVTAAGQNAVIDEIGSFVPNWTSFATALAFASGYGTNSFGYPAAYYLNTNTGEVLFRGGAKPTTGNFASGSTTVATLPSAIRPGQTLEFACASMASGTQPPLLRVEITATGGLTVVVPTTGSYSWVAFDSIRYFIT